MTSSENNEPLTPAQAHEQQETIKHVMESHKVDFAEAVNLLIGGTQIEIPRDPAPGTRDRGDLATLWEGKAAVLRLVDSKRGQSDHATLETAWAYEECAKQLRAAAPAPTTAPEAEQSGDFYLVPREIIDRFPEINVGNYDHDDACTLNSWGCEVVTNASPAPVQKSTATEQGEWTILDVERALYVDRGRDVILCDRDIVGTDGGTLLVKLRAPQPTAMTAEPFDVMATIDPDYAESFEREPAALPSPDTVRGALDPNIPASLRGFARWLRNWAENPKKYHDPMPMTADTLEEIAAKIAAALSSAPVAGAKPAVVDALKQAQNVLRLLSRPSIRNGSPGATISDCLALINDALEGVAATRKDRDTPNVV